MGMETEVSEARPNKKRARRRPKLGRKQERRRQVLRSFMVGAGIVLLQPLAWLPVIRRWQTRLRPPGALEESEFLAACIKCGQCVQVCPVQAIALADADDGLGVGVPFIEARAQACDFSCDALSCILACPTGALDHEVSAKEEVQAGVAVLTNPDTCLARHGLEFRGKARGGEFDGLLRYKEIDRWTPLSVGGHSYDRDLCDLCVLECPIGEKAIGLIPLGAEAPKGAMTPEVRKACVGCGVCEMICPVADAPSIAVKPREHWKNA